MPGTAASLVTLPIAFVLSETGILFYTVATIIVSVMAIPICGRAAKVLGQSDPSCVVLDEVAGMLVSFLPFSYIHFRTPWDGEPVNGAFVLFVSFCFFRFFDIQKPGPIQKLQNIDGGLGIVADDLLAGLMAALATLVLMLFSTVMSATVISGVFNLSSY